MKNNGFTLVEAMMSLAILGFILLSIYGVLVVGNKVYLNDTTMLDMEQQARNGIDRIMRDVRGASSETIVVTDANHDQITFTTPVMVGAKYFVSGTNLIRQQPSGTQGKVASNVGKLKFTQNSTLLTVDIRTDKTIGSQTVSFSMREVVRLRNQ